MVARAELAPAARIRPWHTYHKCTTNMVYGKISSGITGSHVAAARGEPTKARRARSHAIPGPHRSLRLKGQPHTGHNRWHSDIAPILEVAAGEEGVLQTRDASDGQLTPDVTAKQAYILCNMAVVLRVSNIVDLSNIVVSAFLPEDIFTAE